MEINLDDDQITELLELEVLVSPETREVNTGDELNRLSRHIAAGVLGSFKYRRDLEKREAERNDNA